MRAQQQTLFESAAHPRLCWRCGRALTEFGKGYRGCVPCGWQWDTNAEREQRRLKRSGKLVRTKVF
jgi:hypothetical protein